MISGDFGSDSRVQERRQADFLRSFGEFIQYCEGFFNGTRYFVVEVIEELRRDADAELCDRRGEAPEVVGHGLIETVDIQVIVTRDLLENQGGVFCGTGERATMIERPCEGHDTAQAHASPGRLESGDAAEGRRDADPSTGIGAERGEAVAHGYSGRGTSGRSTGHAFEIPWIANRSPIADGGRGTGIELVHVAFADNHGARGFEPAYDFGIFRGNAVFVDCACGGGAHACCIDAVLDPNRNPVQRAAQFTRGLFVREHFGLRQRLLAHDGDPGVDLGVPGLNGIEAGFGEIERREFFGPNADRRLFQAKRAKFGRRIGEGET